MILCHCGSRPTSTQSQDCRRRSRCGRSLPFRRGRDAIRARRVQRRVEARAGVTDQAEKGRQSCPRILRHRAARVPKSGLSTGRPVHPGVDGVSEAPLLRGAAVSRAVLWRRASSAPGVPGSHRQQPPADLVRVRTGVVHRASAHHRSAAAAFQHAARDHPGFESGGNRGRSRGLRAPWRGAGSRGDRTLRACGTPRSRAAAGCGTDRACPVGATARLSPSNCSAPRKG